MKAVGDANTRSKSIEDASSQSGRMRQHCRKGEKVSPGVAGLRDPPSLPAMAHKDGMDRHLQSTKPGRPRPTRCTKGGWPNKRKETWLRNRSERR